MITSQYLIIIVMIVKTRSELVKDEVLLVGVVCHLEAAGQGEVGRELECSLTFPDVDQIVLGPAV